MRMFVCSALLLDLDNIVTMTTVGESYPQQDQYCLCCHYCLSSYFPQLLSRCCIPILASNHALLSFYLTTPTSRYWFI